MRANRNQPARPANDSETTNRRRAHPGVASRDDGQALATARAADYRGFTTAIPSVAKACAVLHATARRGPLGRAATETLTTLLGLLPRGRWHELPVLRVTNTTLSSRVGCSERQVQRHLAVLHQHGVIGIDWGCGNTRLRFDIHASEHEPGAMPGIDLRPALVFAHEQQLLDRAIKTAQQHLQTERHATLDAVWETKQALIHRERRLQPTSYSEAAREIELMRQDVGRISRLANGGKATVAGIEAGSGRLAAVAGRARALRCRLIQETGDNNGEEPGDKIKRSSSDPDKKPNQMTESNFVEAVVLTIQDYRITCLQEDRAAGEAGRAEEGSPGAVAGPVESGADPAAPLLYDRWVGAQDGSRPLASGDLLELEIAARQRAKAMGVAQRVLNEAIQRHGLMPVIGAILHVASLPGRAQVRSPGALLASLLAREAGQLTRQSVRGRPREAEPLGEVEALDIAKRFARSHQPQWIRRQWLKTRARRDEPIGDERRCLEGFAAKLQREHGGHVYD